MKLKNIFYPSFLLLASLSLQSCGGPKAFTRGEYDDASRVELLDDKFDESDMQQMANAVIKSMASCAYIAKAPKPPVVMVEKVLNKTEEHINTVTLTDMIRSALIKTGKVFFVNKEARKILDEEYEYNSAGNVSAHTAKARGKQVGADLIFDGRLTSRVKELGSQKYVYYNLTIDATSISKNLIVCTENFEIRKAFTKQSFR